GPRGARLDARAVAQARGRQGPGPGEPADVRGARPVLLQGPRAVGAAVRPLPPAARPRPDRRAAPRPRGVRAVGPEQPRPAPLARLQPGRGPPRAPRRRPEPPRAR